jgi:hypothetical protein
VGLREEDTQQRGALDARLTEIDRCRPFFVSLLGDRYGWVLDCQYFHVVFTVPDAIAAIALQNKAVVYRLLFRATADTLRTIAADPRHLGAEIGFFAVLHTWGQTLVHHPISTVWYRGRVVTGWQPVGRLSGRILLAGARALATVSSALPAIPAAGLHHRDAPPHRLPVDASR